MKCLIINWLDKWIVGKMESKPSSQSAEKLNNNPDLHFTSNPFIQQNGKTVTHKTGQTTICQNGKMEIYSDIKEELSISSKQPYLHHQQITNTKNLTYKMTFNLLRNQKESPQTFAKREQS